MSTGPSVTIITVTHDHAPFIGPCIESVLAQSRDDWELVVVDDGSSDGTLDMVNRYRDARIQTLALPARGLAGLAESYNAALERSRGPLVAILEGDDRWPPTKLGTQLPLFDDPAVVLSYGAAALIDEYGCTFATYRRRPRPAVSAANLPTGAILPALMQQNLIVAATVMVRRSALEGIGGFWQPAGIPYVDHPTWTRLALEGPFAYAPEVVGMWRRHRTQWTTESATGTQPDRTAYLRAVLGEAQRRGMAADFALLDALVDEGPSAQQRWAILNAYRLALLEGGSRDIARAAFSMVATGRPAWVLIAVAGIGSRVVGSDIEWLLRATDRFSWPSRRHARRHRLAGRT